MKNIKPSFLICFIHIIFFANNMPAWSIVFTDPSAEYEELIQNETCTFEEDYYKDPALEANGLIAGSLRSLGTSLDGDDWEGFTGDEDCAQYEENASYNDVPLGEGVYILTLWAFLYILSKIIGKIYMKYKKKENIQV